MNNTIIMRGLILVLVVVLGWMLFQTLGGSREGSVTNSVPVEGTHDNTPNMPDESFDPLTVDTSREIRQADEIRLPLGGSAPTDNVRHSIPIEEIRQGCFRQDCIPSVDDPEFVSVSEANNILPDDTIGIGLSYKGVERFYPFNMLVTREIVNDTVAGDPLLVTYCPLCGTGVVFDRTVDGEVYEFGVSGMLWQSNLLMYNRASSINDRNLWSQVLGEAVVGNKTGTKLTILLSNVVRYTDWRGDHPDGEVLDTGFVGDPYGGDYYGVARNFRPNFDETDTPLDPSAYVFGIEIDGAFTAYPREELPVGSITDTLNGVTVTVTKTDSDEVTITDSEGDIVPIVTGFWFSWIAAHPETNLWRSN